MKTLFDIKKIVGSGDFEVRHKVPTYAQRLFENMSGELPVEPQQTIWQRESSKLDSLNLKFKFSKREDAKDFVSAIQELEDRMQFFCTIEIVKNEIKISSELSETGIVGDRVKEFLMAAKSIEETINERS